MSDDLRFPIGPYRPPAEYTAGWREACLQSIAATPAALRAAVAGLAPEQLDTPYRPGGWTVRQVVHHVPDSHLHAYVRLKWALTEDSPVIKPYDEGAWAMLPDSQDTPVETSLLLLESLHERWVRLMRALSETEFRRRYRHPETGEHELHHIAGMYAWHGAHHVAHVTRLRERTGW